jgi:hypothetical protein
MLNRYKLGLNSLDRVIEVECETGDWVRYEDAEKLQMRIIELEQLLKTPERLKAEFELDCAAENMKECE